MEGRTGARPPAGRLPPSDVRAGVGMTTGIRGLRRSGWVTFAAVALLVAGVMNVLDGIVALTQEQVYAGDDLIFGDRTALGATYLVIGAVVILAAVLVLKARAFGQFLGIMVAGLNGFWHFLFIGADPARSIPIMVVNGFIIYALTVHGEFFTD